MKINRMGEDKTIIFACEELKSYLERIDLSLNIEIVTENCKEDCLNVGLCDCFDSLLPNVKDKTLDDAIYIDVKGQKGVITGTNPRSVLIAVYRYLKELGTSFIRPGRDNENIPSLKIEERAVKVNEAASYRHREVCIEGACSYEHVCDMIDWIPKMAMNGYFMQFVRPKGFFKVWYEHEGNDYLEKEYKTDNEYAKILEKLEDEIQTRGLLYSVVGHSWQCECLGLDGSYWHKVDEPTDPEIIECLAEVKGERKLFGGVPVNTNLCYSSPKVQHKITDYMIDFIKKKPFTKYLVFWLADDVGNECSCENCRKGSYTDFYIQMLNLLDEKMTKNNMDTKIVPIVMWKYLPDKEKIKNPERFSMMYAPIHRDFSETYPSEVTEEYLKNAIRKIDDPDNTDLNIVLKPTENNVGLLRTWQEIFKGDYLFYDYQMIWFHYMDPSYMFCSNVIYEDIKNLKAIGINGISSCQGQRVFLPTTLPMSTMAQMLWNRDTDYEEFKVKTLTEEYGNDGVRVGEILEQLAIPEMTKMMSGPDALDWNKTKGKATIDLIKSRYMFVEILEELAELNLKKKSLTDAQKKSWEYFKFYPRIARYYLDVWTSAFGEADLEKTRKIAVEMVEYVMKNEEHIHRVFDGCLFRRRIYNFFNTHRLPGIVLDV